MAVKTVWLDLKRNLSLIFSSADITKLSATSGIHVDNLSLVWERNILDNDSTDQQEDDRTTGYSFALEDDWKHDWLSVVHQIGLVIKLVNSARYDEWRATITVDSCDVAGQQASQGPADFFRARLPSIMSFGPVNFVGIASTSSNSGGPFTRVTCDSGSAKHVIHSNFRWPANTGKQNCCYEAHDYIRAGLSDRRTTAVGTVQAQPISKCACLAMEASRAAAKLHTLPVRPAQVSSNDVIQVISRERPFLANVARLTAASSVIATCFRHTTFSESKKRQFDMSTFSQDVVEAFLHFCSCGTVPTRIAEVSVDLAKFSHQYGVNRLLLICEVFLVRELMYCTSVKRLGELAEVALKLELPLLLAAFAIVLKEREQDLVRCAESGRMGPWAQIVDGLAGFEAARFRAVTVLDGLNLAEDCAVVRPNMEVDVV